MTSIVFMREDDNNSSTNLLFDSAYTYCQRLTNEISISLDRHNTHNQVTQNYDNLSQLLLCIYLTKFLNSTVYTNSHPNQTT